LLEGWKSANNSRQFGVIQGNPVQNRLGGRVTTTEEIMLGLIRFRSAVVAAAVLLLSLPSLSYAATGLVHIRTASAGFIVGVGGGSGVLHFRGRNYPLSVGGIGIGTIGAARADMVGRAYNLRTAADIVGTYTAVGSGIAVGGGVKSARLRNQNGVVLELRGRQAGLEASLSLSGITISIR
jgi:hypothetical protein